MNTKDADTSAQYEAAVEAIINHFTKIDKAADTLPSFTAMPMLRFTWVSLKFYFALIGDLIFIIPINVVILLRNILPGSWRYTCWTCKYFKVIGDWLRNGEFVVPGIIVRSLSVFLLHWHFRNRLLALRRRLLLEASLSEESVKASLAKIDRANAFWATTSFGSIMIAWVIPLIGPIIELTKLFSPAKLPEWSNALAILTIGYFIGILAGAFIVKRALIWGASGNAALYAGFLPGSGGYEREREILKPFNLNISEFPLDAALFFASLVLGVITYENQMEFMRSISEQPDEVNSVTGVFRFLTPVLYSIFIGIALVRRKKIGKS